ncbi:GHMP family kinase ATP-binding protein [Roseimaritima ulvae]|uniref:Uncharacterized protein n=1 Tax=Roseimaritima ulvae TaxID=980254 RepID=A0A5B9QW64_9BACT|nr:hypothetical protein [Roseimaritima ulvae]QEG41625.1 hypothetical protein UC8_36510 [Roseimaritima ulvae]
MPSLTEKSTTDPQALEVRTGARLHFGLLDTVAPFGGIGMMIDQPVTHIRLQSATAFSVVGPTAEQPEPEHSELNRRVSDVARRFSQQQSWSGLPSVRITVLRRPAPHSGLGTGTQLAMAVAAGLRRWFDADLPDATIIREVAARGTRSGVGSYGFFSGGLVVDSHPPRRLSVPDAWRVVLLRPRQAPAAVSGRDENQRFATLQQGRPAQRRELEACLAERLEPLARGGRFQAFAEAVREYNYLSGMLFADSQGGPYNGPQVTQLVEDLRQMGYAGVGQSSWGPTVFALCANLANAERLAANPPSSVADAHVAAPLNAAASIAQRVV